MTLFNEITHGGKAAPGRGGNVNAAPMLFVCSGVTQEHFLPPRGGDPVGPAMRVITEPWPDGERSIPLQEK